MNEQEIAETLKAVIKPYYAIIYASPKMGVREIREKTFSDFTRAKEEAIRLKEIGSRYVRLQIRFEKRLDIEF